MGFAVLLIAIRPTAPQPAIAPDCKNGGVLQKDGSCRCLSKAFTGPDCNQLNDYCKLKDYYSACAEGACRKAFGAFYCVVCKNETRKGLNCKRDKNQTVNLLTGPFIARTPQLQPQEALVFLFSVETLGDNITVSLLWGDGHADVRNMSHFRYGPLSSVIGQAKMDLFAPGTPAYNEMPQGSRYYLLLEHRFRDARTGVLKYTMIVTNEPKGKSADMRISCQVYFAEPKHELPILTFPGLPPDRFSDNTPHWTRFADRDIEVLASWPNGSGVVESQDVKFDFVLIVYYGEPNQQERGPYPGGRKRFRILPFSIPVGNHCLMFNVMKSDRVLQSTMGCFAIVSMPVAVVLVGGAKRTVSAEQPLKLDAILSNDQNEPDLSALRFAWSCDEPVEDSMCSSFGLKQTSTYTIPGGSLQPGTVYKFTVTVTRQGAVPVRASQLVNIVDGLTVNVDIVCERNCGRGGTVLTTETVTVRAECTPAGCPPIKWTLTPMVQPNHFPLGMDQTRFAIAGNAMVNNSTYVIGLEGLNEGVGNSSFRLKTQRKLKLSCVISHPTPPPPPPGNPSSPSISPLPRARCSLLESHEASPGDDQTVLYEYFEFPTGDSADPLTGTVILVTSTYTSEEVELNPPVPTNSIVVQATKPSGESGLEELMPKQIYPGRIKLLNSSMTDAKGLFQKGNTEEAFNAIIAGLHWAASNDAANEENLVEVGELMNKYVDPHADISPWRQAASVVTAMAALGARKSKTYDDNLAAELGPLMSTLAGRLVEFATQYDPVDAADSSFIFENIERLHQMAERLVLENDDPVAKNARNLPIDEDIFPADYPMYADTAPGYLKRQMQYRTGVRGTIEAMEKMSTAALWRITPQMDPVVHNVGNMYMWSKVDSLTNFAEQGNLLKEELPFTNVRIDKNEAQAVLDLSENWGLTVVAMKGSPFWFESLPPKHYENTDRCLMLRLSMHNQGPQDTPQLPGLLEVTLPLPPDVNKVVDGIIMIEDVVMPVERIMLQSVLAHKLHVFAGTGAVQVTFLRPAVAKFEILAVFKHSFPILPDFSSRDVFHLSWFKDEENLTIGLPLQRKNEFIYIGLALSKESIESAVQNGQVPLVQKYSFIPRNLMCKRWNDTAYQWLPGTDTEVWAKSNGSQLVCRPSHLSLFAGLVLIAPDYVHPVNDAHLFLTLARNWIVFAYVIASLTIWLGWLLFARRQDRQEEGMWRVVVLDDIVPEADYPYLVTVFSGNLGRGQTSAHVGMRLVGDWGDSGPHMLSHSYRLMSRSYDDWFVLYTVGSLGNLTELELWTDCAGLRPYWYVEKVVVEDIQTGRVWTFVGYCWLSLEHGSGVASAVLRPGEISWTHRFYSIFKASVRGDHIWASVLLRHPRMTFTRAQRLTVAFGQHFLDMLVSIMFFNAVERDMVEESNISELFARTLVVAFESSLITLLPSTILAWLFQVEHVETTNTGGKERLTLEDDADKAVGERTKAGSISSTGSALRLSAQVDNQGYGEQAVGHAPSLQATGSQSPCNTQLGCSAYRKLRIRVHRQRTGGPLVNIYLGGAQEDVLLKRNGTLTGQLRDMGDTASPEGKYGASWRDDTRQVHIGEMEKTARPVKKTDRSLFKRFRSSLTLRQKCTPRLILAWLTTVATIAVCSYFTVLYGLSYGWLASYEWVTSMMASLLLGIFLLQPVKIAFMAFTFAYWFQAEPELEKKEAPHTRPVRLPPLQPPKQRSVGTTVDMYRKLTRSEAEVLLVLRRHRQRLISRAWDTMLWLLWMILMYVCVANASDTLHYYFNKHVQNMVLLASHTRTRQFGQFYDTKSYTEVFDYLRNTVIGSMLNRKVPSNMTPEVLIPYVAFSIDNVTRLLGTIRLRQQRVIEESSCSVPLVFSKLAGYSENCYSDFAVSWGDTSDYGQKWESEDPEMAADPSLGKNILPVWKYYLPEWSEILPTFAQDSFFPAGGYVATLGRAAENADMTLTYLMSNGWIDNRVRGLFIEFVVYSFPSNILSDVILTFERFAASSFHVIPRLNTFRLSYTTGKWTGINLVCLLLLVAVSVAIMARELISLVRKGKDYSWNWFDVVMILIVAVNAFSYLTVNLTLSQLLRHLQPTQNPSAFVSLETISVVHFIVMAMLGLLVVFSTVRCWTVLSFATHFQIVKIMLKAAYRPLLAVMSHLLLTQLQFTFLFVLLMGSNNNNLHTVQNAYVLLMAYLMDYTEDYEEFENSSHDTSLVLIAYWIFVAFMFFYFLNFFLGIVSMAFESANAEVRQRELQGFSISNLIVDELRFLLHLPGGKLRRDSSLFRMFKRGFVATKTRIYGDTVTVARSELDALRAVVANATGHPIDGENMKCAMAVLALTATRNDLDFTGMGPLTTFWSGHSWDGEEMLDTDWLHSAAAAINSRSKKDDMAVEAHQIHEIRSVLKQWRELTPGRAIPLAIRARIGAATKRPTNRVAHLIISRGRCVRVRFRLRRVPAPRVTKPPDQVRKPEKPKDDRPPWRY